MGYPGRNAMSRGSLAATLGVGTLILLIGGCTDPSLFSHGHVLYSEDAANVYVSAYPAVPWTNISAKLSPNNNLTIEQASAMAVQVTQAEQSQAISTLAAGFALTLPGTSSISTTTSSNGVTQTTASRTTSSGAVPSSSGTPSATIPAASAPSALAAAVDGSTLLTERTGLFQLAQILDNQIANEVLPEGYQVYLLTFQINLQPLHRDLPYDAYTDVSLFPANWSEAVATSDLTSKDAGQLPAVKLYPLIITDAMEATSVGRSVQIIRQASLQLSGIIYGAGVSAGLGRGSSDAQSVVGLDKNSVVTVGRVNDNTFRVRIGAENSGSSGLALVPRSYNVSVVAMTRWTQASKTDRVTALSVVTNTTIRNDKGQKLDVGPARSRPKLAQEVATNVNDFLAGSGFPVTPGVVRGGIAGDCGAAVPRKSDGSGPDLTQISKDSPSTSTALNLLRALDRGDYTTVSNCLGLDTKAKASITQEMTLQRLLATLEQLQVDSRYSTFLISLQSYSDNPRYPDPTQLVIFSDDETQSASVTVRGGSGIDAKRLKAAMLFKDKATKLLPNAISLVGDGSQIDIAFPSLKKIGIDSAKDLDVKPLILTLDSQPDQPYAIKAISTAAAAKISNPVQATQNILDADASGQATVNLVASKDIAASATLAITGADIRVVAGAATRSPSGIGLNAGGGLVTLTLGNLIPAIPVKLTTMTVPAGGKSPQAVGDPIVLTVVSLSGK